MSGHIAMRQEARQTYGANTRSILPSPACPEQMPQHPVPALCASISKDNYHRAPQCIMISKGGIAGKKDAFPHPARLRLESDRHMRMNDCPIFPPAPDGLGSIPATHRHARAAILIAKHRAEIKFCQGRNDASGRAWAFHGNHLIRLLSFGAACQGRHSRPNNIDVELCKFLINLFLLYCYCNLSGYTV